MNGHSLRGLQAWMQNRVTAGPGSVGKDDADIRAVVVSSAALPAERRLGIYASSYVSRLAECMRTEFPVLRRLIGERVFDLFVGGYLSVRPPTSYSLYDLGAGFADYLEASRPEPHSGPGTLEALPASLARLERALAEAERAEGVEDPTQGHWSFDVLSMLHDAERRLCVPRSLALLRLDFDFTQTLATAQTEGPLEMPVPRETLVAVARSHYRVCAYVLETWAFVWLKALAENGGDVLGANQAVADVTGRDSGAVLADLLVWLPLAAEYGFVA